MKANVKDLLAEVWFDLARCALLVGIRRNVTASLRFNREDVPHAAV